MRDQSPAPAPAPAHPSIPRLFLQFFRLEFLVEGESHQKEREASLKPEMERVRNLASERAAVIFTKSSCCICHSVKTLFYELGASPAVHELDREANGREMEVALRGMGCNPCVPAVFIGGKFVGSAKDIISLHVNGSLKQMLMDAKAIWF